MQRFRTIYDFVCLLCGKWIRGQRLMEVIDRSSPLSTNRGLIRY